MRRVVAPFVTALLTLAFVGGCGVKVESIRVEPSSLTLHHRESSSPFTVTAYNARGEVLPAAPLTWSSGDTSVLVVDQTGRVTPLKSGTTTVTVASGRAQAVVPVTVALYVSLATSDSAVDLAVGGTKLLSATILDENQNPVPGPISWESADPTVATVTSEGLVTAVSPGQTAVLASAPGLPNVQIPVRVVPGKAR